MAGRFYIRIISIVLPSLLSSCVVINLTKHSNETVTKCSIHNEVLEKALVQAHYGKTRIYTNTTLFPYSKKPAEMGCLCPIWPSRRLAIVLTCDSCTMLYRKWKLNRKENGDF